MGFHGIAHPNIFKTMGMEGVKNLRWMRLLLKNTSKAMLLKMDHINIYPIMSFW